MNMNKDDDSYQSRHHHKGTGASTLAFFANPYAVKKSHYDYQFYLQRYNNEQLKSVTMDDELLQKTFPCSTESEDLLIYLPICLYDEMYSKPDQFEDFLTGMLAPFRPRRIHIALTVPDELYRHNLFKENFMSSNAGPGPDMKSPTLCLKANEECRLEARKAGDRWLSSISFPDLASRLSCKITLFRWDELVTCPDLRTLFIGKMGIKEKPKLVDREISLHELAQFVEDQHALGTGFASAIYPKLLEQSQKNLARWPLSLNVNVSEQSDKRFMFEEFAHVMHVASTGLFNLIIQSQVFNKRKSSPRPGMALFGEVLFHWACKLLTLFLENPGCNFNQDEPKRYDFTMAPNIPLYITVGRYPLPTIVKTVYTTPSSPSGHAPLKNSTPTQTTAPQPPVLEMPQPTTDQTLEEKFLKSVIDAGGFKKIKSSSEIDMVTSALRWAGDVVQSNRLEKRSPMDLKLANETTEGHPDLRK
jgi:hypothetical protein